jgi:hypothetical protein
MNSVHRSFKNSRDLVSSQSMYLKRPGNFLFKKSASNGLLRAGFGGALMSLPPYTGSVSVALHGKDKDLAGLNKIWIPDPVSVCPIHDRVSCAVAIGDAADAPQAVAA